MNNSSEENRDAWLAEGNAKQARKRVATKALITDDTGQILLVNPTYKRYWDLPGGMAEPNEPPTAALQREIREELGIHITVGHLLTLDWIGPHGPWDDQLVFLFDGGILTQHDVDNVRVSDTEISDFGFFPLPEAVRLLRADIAGRLTRATTTKETGHATYTETRPE